MIILADTAFVNETKPVQRLSFTWHEMKRNKVAYAYITPFYVLFIIFGLFPIISGFMLSFTNWDGFGDMNFIGLRNYVRLLSDPLFWRALENTIYIGIYAHIFILFGGLVLAYVLNSTLIKIKNTFKLAFFLPVVTSAVAISIIFQSIFGLHFGLINYVLEFMGFTKIDWWGGAGNYIKIAIIILFSWRWIGWNMVIYIAGMQGISNDIYEAATIDGATHTQVFFRITIPLLKPIILFTLIQSTIGTINLFTEPFLLTGSLLGGAGNQGLTVMMYLLRMAPYGDNFYGYASAVAYVLTTIIILVSVINIKFFEPDDRKMKGEK